MSNEDKLVLLYHLRRLRALERLTAMGDLSCVLTPQAEERREYRETIIQDAYSDNEDLMHRALAYERPRPSDR